ncbi:signal recognition particle protein [Treponema sp. OMZ 792]|uniref:signal recognition particle protein n=1 Tax=unclassified Treponema TaxID=2638727 RepID=UPI0020A2E535|nr:MULTISPECIES: signal recognition particle protein [unclassified Treponema]UTC75741.1 signal recognition particle protein [Treponema sp. OMZ 792]UTC78451.1 signal recognition particle protein [Treponema sp. OMZ 799]UTC79740.1 signal recognition particle protein [Treponema sp. OMZ 798]
MLENITEKFGGILRSLSGKSKITEKNIEDTIEEIKTALLDADVNLRVVRRFINATAEEAKGERVLKSVDPGQQFTKIVYDKMTSFLGDEKKALDLRGPDTQSIILFLGLQGSGKTTSAAKLALKLKNEGRKPLLAACDLVRPAAVEQLSVLGENIGVPVYKEETKDAVRVAKNALAFAKKNFYDTVIVDTAGRLQIDEDMMKEIVNIKSAVKPMETILVADSMTGQSAVDVAKEFDEQVGLSGLILTKFDSDTRGGAALSLKTITGKPIFYIGTGEKLEDFEAFYPDRIASRILGMGDIVSLVEKAQALYDEEEAEKLQKKMQSESFSLADMLMQLEQAEKMGPLESMLDMIPGLSGQIDKDKLDLSLLKRQKAIIQSMTLKERDNFRIIGPPRRKRIAKGSGTSVGDVNKLLKQFEKTRQMMRKVSKNKGLQAKMMSGGFFG